MFKNIQKYLLLHYPLLWNTKFIPMLIIGIAFNIISFFFGYLDGKIDFSNKKTPDIEFVFITFGILIVIVAIILWLVNYLKNNAFKSFYSKSNFSLFYEWVQIFIVLVLLISFSVPFEIGKNLRQRSYFSKEEATKRCETISKADVFIDGYFGPTISETEVNQERNDTTPKKDYILFEGKKYDQYSLMNRRVYEFSLVTFENNLSNRIAIQKNLVNDNKIAIKNLMDDYLKIVHEHKLLTNLNTDIWFTNVYKNYPTFVDFLFIKPYYNDDEKYYNYNNGHGYNYNEYENDNSKYSEFYMQQDILKHNYDKVSVAFTEDLVNTNLLLTLLNVAFGLSLALFSFKVTSGKNWLIALVSVGILNIAFGILSSIVAFTGIDFLVYPYLCLAVIFAVIIYFFSKYFQGKDKGKSSIVLNIFLWTFAMIIPIIYFLMMGFHNRYDKQYLTQVNTYEWYDNHIPDMFLINLIVSIIVLFFIANMIRKWKGMAED